MKFYEALEEIKGRLTTYLSKYHVDCYYYGEYTSWCIDGRSIRNTSENGAQLQTCWMLFVDLATSNEQQWVSVRMMRTAVSGEFDPTKKDNPYETIKLKFSLEEAPDKIIEELRALMAIEPKTALISEYMEIEKLREEQRRLQDEKAQGDVE